MSQLEANLQVFVNAATKGPRQFQQYAAAANNIISELAGTYLLTQVGESLMLHQDTVVKLNLHTDKSVRGRQIISLLISTLDTRVTTPRQRQAMERILLTQKHLLGAMVDNPTPNKTVAQYITNTFGLPA